MKRSAWRVSCTWSRILQGALCIAPPQEQEQTAESRDDMGEESSETADVEKKTRFRVKVKSGTVGIKLVSSLDSTLLNIWYFNQNFITFK